MDEMLDVVDSGDRVVGRARRAQIHRQKLLHRAVHLFIFNAAGQLFLQRRSMFKDTAPGLWSTSCAGHVDSGESYDDAVVREAMEELALALKTVPAKVAFLPAEVHTGLEFVQIYRTQAEGPFQMPPEEIEEGRWWTLQEIYSGLESNPEIFAASFRHIWGHIQQQVLRRGA